MKEADKRYFCNENKNIHVLGKEIMLTVEGEEIQFDLVSCPHCEGLFAVESFYPDNIHSVLHCPFCCLEVGIEDKCTFLFYDDKGEYTDDGWNYK